MPDYRGMYDSEYLGHWDLQGKEHTVTISKIEVGKLTAQGGRKSKRPIVYFEGKEKGLVVNKTNGKVIASMYGPITESWVGQQVVLYPTTTNFGADVVECIRVKHAGGPSVRHMSPKEMDDSVIAMVHADRERESQ